MLVTAVVSRDRGSSTWSPRSGSRLVGSAAFGTGAGIRGGCLRRPAGRRGEPAGAVEDPRTALRPCATGETRLAGAEREGWRAEELLVDAGCPAVLQRLSPAVSRRGARGARRATRGSNVAAAARLAAHGRLAAETRAAGPRASARRGATSVATASTVAARMEFEAERTSASCTGSRKIARRRQLLGRRHVGDAARRRALAAIRWSPSSASRPRCSDRRSAARSARSASEGAGRGLLRARASRDCRRAQGRRRVQQVRGPWRDVEVRPARRPAGRNAGGAQVAPAAGPREALRRQS